MQEDSMQDDNRRTAEPLDPGAKPPSQDEMNRPGMTNGVPDQANEAESKGRPTDERKQSEVAPATTESGGGGS
jgi:hypothetical protein